MEIIKQTVPTFLKPVGYRTSSRDSVRLFEGEGKKSAKGLLTMCNGFEDAVVAAIRHEQEFLGRKLSTKIRSSAKVSSGIRSKVAARLPQAPPEGAVEAWRATLQWGGRRVHEASSPGQGMDVPGTRRRAVHDKSFRGFRSVATSSSKR